MPRESRLAITQNPVTQDTTRAQALQITARPVPIGIATNQASDFDGLLAGLKSINPEIEKYVDVTNKIDGQEARLAGTVKEETRVVDPANVMDEPGAMPEHINPAFRPAFDQAYKQSLGQRLGIDSTAAIAAEYDKQKLTEGFDARKFLGDQFKQHSMGMEDMTVAAEVSKRHIELSKMILASDNTIKLQQLKESTVSNEAVILNDMIDKAAGDPSNAHAAISNHLNTSGAWQQYMTRPEMASRVVDAVTAKSIQGNGTPAMFDVLDRIKDPATGKTITELNPDLAIKVEIGRKTAQQQFDRKIETDSQRTNFETMASVQDGLAAGSRAYDDNWIAQNTGGPGTLFPTTEAALAFRRQRETALNAGTDTGTTLEWMKNGQGYWATPKQQKDASDYVTTPLVNDLMTLVDDPAKQAELNDKVIQFARIHSDSGLSVPNEILGRFINGLTTEAPAKDGKQSPRFLAAAQMYQTMPPNIRDMYFKDDAAKLFDQYTKEVSAQTAPETAYAQAYQGISLEAKEREKELVKDPAWQEKMLKITSKAVDSLKYQPTKDYVPFRDNLPENLDTLTRGAAPLEAKRFMLTRPNATEGDLKEYMQKWVSNNYVHDTTSNMLIGVPPAAGQGSDKAISWYQENLAKRYGADARTTLVYMGGNNYQVLSLATNTVKGTVTWPELMNQHVNATAVTDADRLILSDLHKKAGTGTLTSADVQGSSAVLSKMRALGLDKTVPMKEINNALDASTRAAFAAIPKLSLGGTSTVLDPVANPLNDRVSQKTSTNHFIRSGTPQGLAAALVTQGEGVALRAYPDPAGGAGKNIGMGYNLNANKANIAEDFRRAGIPVEAIEDIKAGRKSITADQAERLLVATLPRYMKRAEDTVEKVRPGMWERMTPQQKAVVTDVAYQVKDIGKFAPSIEALFSGDQERIDKSFQVHYTDHKGVTKPDTRRNNLRGLLLSGVPTFKAVASNN